MTEAHGAVETWRLALTEDRVTVRFQPVVSVETGKIAYYETLLRIRDRRGGFIFPDAFIPGAEQAEIMVEVDAWVIERVLAMFNRNRTRRFLINVSATSLDNETFRESVACLVKKADLPEGHLVFEITESRHSRQMNEVGAWIDRMRGLGCRFALDDFGVGFSSFSFLKSTPVDIVKIDGSFVVNMDVDAANRAIVEAIAKVARAMKKVVIAEWVETKRVATMLKGMGIHYGQGYFWSQPRELDA